MIEENDSDFLFHVACPKCGSSDACGVYSDGHKFCFSCDHYEHGEEGKSQEAVPKKKTRGLIPQDTIDMRRIGPRALDEATVQKWGYGYARHNGSKCHVASYRNAAGAVVAQKVRGQDKEFTVLGKMKDALPLYGQWLWPEGKKRVIITEGEIDALSVYQAQGKNAWPVVSVPTGAKGAKRSIAAALEWLETFEEVVFYFDNDDKGEAAVEECVPLLSSGKAKIVAHDPRYKDANAALMAGHPEVIQKAIWDATVWRPQGIVAFSELRERITREIERGFPWWMDSMTELTYGRRLGEVIAFGAGTGVGKTDFLTQQMKYDLTELGEKVGCFMLEQQPEETAKRICGKFAGKRFHVPDGSWTEDDLLSAFDEVDKTGKLFMFDHFGCMDWDIISRTIRFMAHSEGVRIFYIDHLTAIATGADVDDERKELENVMAAIASLAKELNILIHIVSHLATPDGKPHEEGGRVMIRHFKGSRAIGYWCHFMIGFERDQQAENEEERSLTTVRFLKDRLSGQATGQTRFMGYEQDTALLYETTNEFVDEGGGEHTSDFF